MPDTTTNDDTWGKNASTWDDDPAVVAYANAAFASLREHVVLRATDRVLDFGCGTGLLTERIAPSVSQLVSVDASPAMVDVLRRKALPNVVPLVATWTPESVAVDPETTAGFDLVVCSSVCAFLDDYPGAVAMLGGLLRPGGRFVQWDWAFDPQAEEPFGLTVEAIDAALRGAGLEVDFVGTGFDLPFGEQRMAPLMGVGRKSG